VQHGRPLFAARRADIECYVRTWRPQAGPRATIARRLCTIAGFYRYAVEEDLLEHSPAAHVRRPRLDYESRAAGLDRNDVGALLVAAGLGSAAEHALISLLAINGSPKPTTQTLTTSAWNRTLTVLRKGGKIVTIPLAPRTARAIDLTAGERLDGPIFLRADRQRTDRHCTSRILRRVARRAGLDKKITPHTLRHAFITAALDAGVPLRDVQEAASHADPRTTCATTTPASPSTGTPPTSSPPTSPEPHANPRQRAVRARPPRAARALKPLIRARRCRRFRLDASRT
jgi:integrase/recombinase XerD